MADTPYHHGDLRNSLIEAGIKLINNEGEEKFSLRKVASLCGVSHAAPYSHFQNKEELLEAMQAHVVNQLMERFEDITKTFSEPNDQKQILMLGKSYVMFFIDNPHYFPFLFSKSYIEINLSLNDDGSKNFPPFELFKTTTLRVLRASGFPEHKLEDAIITCWATVHGLSAIATMKNVHYDKNWEEKIEDIIWNK